MVEFAGIMYLQRKNELRKLNQVSIEGESLRSEFEMMKLLTKIDGIAMIIFTFTYSAFNITYWIINLA